MFDPAAKTWRPVPSAPLDGRSEAAAVWTGKEVIVWSGWADYGYPKGDGAAYDPATSTWRSLPRAPLSTRQPVAVIWTGKEMIVWGDANRSEAARDGAAYDPALDRWRRIDNAPFALNEASAAWTGREMIVVGALLDGQNLSDTPHARGLAYDPRSNSWRLIAASKLSPQASSVAWTGKELVAWDYELRTAAYDPARDTWRPLPSLPLHFSECYPESATVVDVVLAWYCGRAALFDVRSGTWRSIEVPRQEVSGVPVAAGSGVIFAGPAAENQAPAFSAYVPDGGTAEVAKGPGWAMQCGLVGKS